MIQHIVQTEYFTDSLIALVFGIIGAETRIALDQVRFTKHPKFITLSKKDRTDVPFRLQRWLIGAVAAFVGVVTLGTFMPVLHATVVAVLASLGGNVFLTSRVEGGENGEHYEFLRSMVEKSDERVASDFGEIANFVRNLTARSAQTETSATQETLDQ